jgi:hypothetical protein
LKYELPSISVSPRWWRALSASTFCWVPLAGTISHAARGGCSC